MGGDGGTIPKRKDRVKTKSRSEPKSKYNTEGERDPLERWKVCPISGLPIRRPVMSGQLGHILSKEGVIEYLLKKRSDTEHSLHVREESSPVCDTLHKMSDVIELKLKDNTALTNNNLPSEERYHIGNFICPITGLETNGKYKFVFSWKCGCVVSERALKQCNQSEKIDSRKCLVCEKAYEPFDLVLINPVTDKELEENQMKFMARKAIPIDRAKKGHQSKSDASSSYFSSISEHPSGKSPTSKSLTKAPSDSTTQIYHKSSSHQSLSSRAGGNVHPVSGTSSYCQSSNSRSSSTKDVASKSSSDHSGRSHLSHSSQSRRHHIYSGSSSNSSKRERSPDSSGRSAAYLKRTK